MVNDAKVTPEAAVQAAQKEADALMKPYVDKTALAEVSDALPSSSPSLALSLRRGDGTALWLSPWARERGLSGAVVEP